MTDVTTTAQAPNNPTPPGPLTQRQTEPTRHDGSPRAGVISDAAYDALPPADRDRFARVRQGPQGGSEWRDRSTLPSEAPDPAAKPGDPAKPGSTAEPTVTADGKLRVGDYELSRDDIAMLVQTKAETDLRRAAVPADPSQYKIELPKNFVLPAGLEWKWNESDPALAAARTWSHAQGLTQDQFSSLLGQYASMEAAKESTFRAAMKRELDALGANATMRVTALETWLTGVVGPDIAKHMKAGMFSARIVEGFEKIANKMATQGHASPRSRRVPLPTAPRGRLHERRPSRFVSSLRRPSCSAGPHPRAAGRARAGQQRRIDRRGADTAGDGADDAR
jgi:hypothetical protein